MKLRMAVTTMAINGKQAAMIVHDQGRKGGPSGEGGRNIKVAGFGCTVLGNFD
jgi:hypothetical protein